MSCVPNSIIANVCHLWSFFFLSPLSSYVLHLDCKSKALPGESGYPIHPTKAFESHRDRPISGGKQVLFRDLHPEDAEGEEEWKMAPVVFQEDNVLGAEDEDEDDYE